MNANPSSEGKHSTSSIHIVHKKNVKKKITPQSSNKRGNTKKRTTPNTKNYTTISNYFCSYIDLPITL